MANVSNVISFEQFVRDFDSLFKHRVFRLETLDYYHAENEREPFGRFIVGDPPDWAWREPWKRIVRGHLAAGRIMQRVHVISEPPPDYIRFELLRVYPANVDAGEYVGIVGRAEADDLLPLGGDFWLFDDDLVAYLEYDRGDGAVRHVQMLNSEGAVSAAVALRDDALRLSTPLARYVAEHNITERKHAA